MTAPSASNESASTGYLHLPGWLAAILRVFIIAVLPLLLVLVNARLLMSRPFMVWEYNRPGFSPDPYGFTTEDRLHYGPLGLAYLFNGEGTSFLSDLRFPDGSPVFNERELSHMDDVKQVTQMLVRSGLALMALFTLCVVLLASDGAHRARLLQALFNGSVLTVLLIVTGLGAVALAFNWLFTAFHSLFFEGTSWLFPTSDTLIRLYPEQFWVDAFAVVFGAALVEAILLGVVTRRALRR
jgi:integral membrane protein (TIGR01906 family)